MTTNANHSKKASAYLGQGNDLQNLLARIEELRRLNDKLMAFIEPHLRDYCQVANVINGKLVLIVANSSVATHIRFQTYVLLEKFKQQRELASIKQIECKVRPFSLLTAKIQDYHLPKLAPISAKTASIIHETASSIADPTVREILQRIASFRFMDPANKSRDEEGEAIMANKSWDDE